LFYDRPIRFAEPEVARTASTALAQQHKVSASGVTQPSSPAATKTPLQAVHQG